MAEIIEGVSPTRMELLKLRKRRDLAKKGHALLKEKQDALIMEFFDILEEARSARIKVIDQLKDAYHELMLAKAQLGTLTTESAALAVKETAELEIETRSIMGVLVPLLESEEITRTVMEQGYGFMDTSAKLDEAARKFQESLASIVQLAEVEETVRALAEEIQKTKRRVSALEHVLIPRLENTVNYIDMRLEEMERENFFRLKRIKQRLTAEES